MKNILTFILVFTCLSTSLSWGQFSDRETTYQRKKKPDINESYFNKPIDLIDLPTASILRGGDLRTILRFYDQGSVMARLTVGISRRLNFGVSYAGEHIIGGDQVEWSEMPGVHFAFRIFEETRESAIPAVVIGIDTQGYGLYWRESDYPDSFNVQSTTNMLERYTYKARGFYAVASRGYQSFRKVGIHAGASLSLENSDSDRDPTLFMGADVEITNEISGVIEYDFGLNDDRVRSANNGSGFLNTSLRWAFTRGMSVEFALKNLFAEKHAEYGLQRIVRISYHGSVIR
jgi:hypothetical protein